MIKKKFNVMTIDLVFFQGIHGGETTQTLQV